MTGEELAARRKKVVAEAVAHAPTRAYLASLLPVVEDVTFNPDARVHAFNEGRRALVLELVNELRALGLYRSVYDARFEDPDA